MTDNIVAGIRQKQYDSVGCIYAGVCVVVGEMASQGRSFYALKLIIITRRADDGLAQQLSIFCGATAWVSRLRLGGY